MSRRAITGGGDGDGGERRRVTGGAGAMIMKSVSLFLTKGRRASKSGLQQSQQQGRSSNLRSSNMTSDSPELVAPRPRRRRSNAIEDSSGKINPKILEAYKKKTHFTNVNILENEILLVNLRVRGLSRQTDNVAEWNKICTKHHPYDGGEIEALVRIYRKLVSNCKVTTRAATSGSSVIAKPHSTVEGVDRAVFRELLHTTFDIVTEDLIMERIFCAWEKGFEGLPIRLEGWIMGLNTFLRGSQEEKMAYCFRVYDLNCDGFITKDEMFALLRNCLIKQPQDEDPDEGVRDIVEIALKKFDHDKDGKLNFTDFQTAVTEEPLLLEAFGQCLPSESATVSFLSTLQS